MPHLYKIKLWTEAAGDINFVSELDFPADDASETIEMLEQNYPQLKGHFKSEVVS